MLCQNCGRRSSDKLNFCSHCGAIASPDPPTSPIESRRAPAARLSRPSVRAADTASPKYKTSRQPTSAGEGASGFSRLILFAIAFGMVYWFTKTDDFDLITFIRSAIESNLASLVRPPDPR